MFQVPYAVESSSTATLPLHGSSLPSYSFLFLSRFYAIENDSILVANVNSFCHALSGHILQTARPFPHPTTYRSRYFKRYLCHINRISLLYAPAQEGNSVCDGGLISSHRQAATDPGSRSCETKSYSSTTTCSRLPAFLLLFHHFFIVSSSWSTKF